MQAIPIHHHIYVDRGDRKVLVDTVTEDVAPADTDSDGVANADDGCPSDPGSLANGCDPAPPPPVTAPTSTPTAAPVATGSSPLPTCTWQPESGGDPTALNPSGAGGYYQIMPSTWAANGGTGAPQDAPMSEQTAVAERVWATQGPGAWVNC